MNSRRENSSPEYFEYIFNWPATGIFVFFDLGLVILILAEGVSLPLIIASFVAFFIYINFFSLKIEVQRGEVFLSYGIGLFSSVYSQSDISRYQVDSTKTLYSWFFNPFCEEVAVLRLRDGQEKVIPSSFARKFIESLRARN